MAQPAHARTLAELRRIKGFDVTAVATIFDRLPHFRQYPGHRPHDPVAVGDSYNFAWTPSTPEQGAPKE
jgi:hypothetical protein